MTPSGCLSSELKARSESKREQSTPGSDLSGLSRRCAPKGEAPSPGGLPTSPRLSGNLGPSWDGAGPRSREADAGEGDSDRHSRGIGAPLPALGWVRSCLL